jgi:hypothetical protein
MVLSAHFSFFRSFGEVLNFFQNTRDSGLRSHLVQQRNEFLQARFDLFALCMSGRVVGL